MTHQDAGLGDMPEIKGFFDLEQIVQDAGGEIANVGGALAQIFVLGGEQGLGEAFGGAVKGVFGIGLLLLDQMEDFIQQVRIVQHLEVRLENIRLLGAEILGDLVLDLQDLQPGLDQGFFEPVNFRRELFGGEFAMDDDPPGAMHDENFPAANA